MIVNIMIFYIIKINILFVSLTVHTIYGNDIIHERDSCVSSQYCGYLNINADGSEDQCYGSDVIFQLPENCPEMCDLLFRLCGNVTVHNDSDYTVHNDSDYTVHNNSGSTVHNSGNTVHNNIGMTVHNNSASTVHNNTGCNIINNTECNNGLNSAFNNVDCFCNVTRENSCTEEDSNQNFSQSSTPNYTVQFCFDLAYNRTKNYSRSFYLTYNQTRNCSLFYYNQYQSSNLSQEEYFTTDSFEGILKTTNICKKYNYCWHPYEYCNCSATWDAESNEIISDSTSYQNCESFGIDSVCDSCKLGWFGDYCDQPCSPYCKDRECDHDSGLCPICVGGWFGDSCNQQCLSNCKTCFDNSTCIECDDGFFGRHCERNCSDDCKTCSKDDKICQTCISDNSYGDQCSCKGNQCLKYSPFLYCIECKQPGWFISRGGCCPCSNYCIGGPTNCDNMTGACLDGCQSGYYGVRCNDKCSSHHCTGNETFCDSLTGECQYGCEDDWALTTCDYECSLFYPYCAKCSNFSDGRDQKVRCSACIDGYFMPLKHNTSEISEAFKRNYCFPCDHCLNGRCDGSSGLCIDGCKEHGKYNSKEPIDGEVHCVLECDTCFGMSCNFTNGTCLNGCESGYFGEKCQSNCSTTCVNETCQQSSGDCLSCEIGYYGSTCNYTCGQCNGGVCKQATGECEDKCLTGYYGTKCDKACNSCVGNICDINGKCVYGCMPGQFGDLCNLNCSDDCFVCHPVDGTCIIKNLTQVGTTSIPASNISNSPCNPGRYGFDCSRFCAIACKKRSNNPRICHKFTGYCDDCLMGFHGYDCSNQCNRTCIDKVCSRNGTCLKGCTIRWQGIYCQNHFPKTAFEQYSGILFGVMCFTVFSLGITYVTYRKRHEQQRKHIKQKAAHLRNNEETKTFV